MAVRLFVGNLPYGATEVEIREYFATVGEPTQIIMPVDRDTGRPRGFAFVEYADRSVAEEAIKKFDAQVFKGRPLAVSEARPREERGPRPPSSGFGGPRPPRAFDSSPPPQPGRGGPPPRRESGGGAQGRRGGKRSQWSEERPKRPIQVRTTGRIFAVDDDDSGEDVEIDNFATSLPKDADAPSGAGDPPGSGTPAGAGEADNPDADAPDADAPHNDE